ncbi:MAG: toll/interleukin-1 receptor domain-containing protein [Anaerolineaceae bacterium]|nr:toll/interleukin-1 receptor domain-containing protein [Anaerolineaceae bacterium]
MTEDSKKEWNPLEEEAPEDSLGQARVLARDLAWGVINELWDVEFSISQTADGIRHWWLVGRLYDRSRDIFASYVTSKWGGNMPSERLLVSLGFFDLSDTTRQLQINYRLTEKSFKLLEEPLSPPSVFISYRRPVSSALTLAIEARLKHKDSLIGIFIDKSLTVGEPWHGELQERIRECEYFICLLGEIHVPNDKGEYEIVSSLQSEYVLQEIAWAIENKKTIITILHPDYRLPKRDNYQISSKLHEALDRRHIAFWNIINTLEQTQAIQVDSESAKHYESAINELINALGYSTI